MQTIRNIWRKFARTWLSACPLNKADWPAKLRFRRNIYQILLLRFNLIECHCKDEVLQVCDQLYLNEKITENQLLYLRHLVLIREEPVAALYDDFQEVSSSLSYFSSWLNISPCLHSASECALAGEGSVRARIHSSIPQSSERNRFECKRKRSQLFLLPFHFVRLYRNMNHRSLQKNPKKRLQMKSTATMMTMKRIFTRKKK